MTQSYYLIFVMNPGIFWTRGICEAKRYILIIIKLQEIIGWRVCPQWLISRCRRNIYKCSSAWICIRESDLAVQLLSNSMNENPLVDIFSARWAFHELKYGWYHALVNYEIRFITLIQVIKSIVDFPVEKSKYNYCLNLCLTQTILKESLLNPNYILNNVNTKSSFDKTVDLGMLCIIWNS